MSYKCPSCKTRLKCQDSRPSDNYTTIREYGCPECKKVFLSIEQLDTGSIERTIHNRLINKRLEEYKDAEGIHSK